MADASAPRSSTASPLGRALSVSVKLGLALALVAGLYDVRFQDAASEETYFWTQDLPMLPVLFLLLLALRYAPWRSFLPLARAATRRPGAWALGLAALVFIIGALGTRFLFAGYDLSMDEFMADFDATIFAHGQLMALTPAAWRDYLPALQPLFMLPTPGRAFEASSYLPMNAAFRALGGLIHARWLVNPFWSALSVVAVFGVARRLWPAQPRIAIAAAALLATSSQLAITAMTAYAMPAHLALNLVWLWLFLRNDWKGHLGAAVVAFVACGLHQVAFHPLFAAPFVLQLWLDRRWRSAGFYTVVYGLICLFWIGWPSLELRLMGVAPVAAGSLGPNWFLARAEAVLNKSRLNAFGQMAECLLRFVTWQNPLTIPLALIATVGALRAKGHLRALVWGVVLTVLAMLVLEPTQGHGWGYRYLHGLMGSICLVAAWGWDRLTRPLPAPQRSAATAAFAAAAVASLAILLPIRATQAWLYTAPYATANALIQSARTEVVIVDNDAPGYVINGGTIVRNGPYPGHGPKVMTLQALTDPTVRDLCARYTVSVFGPADIRALGMEIIPPFDDPDTVRLTALMKQIGCWRPLG